MRAPPPLGQAEDDDFHPGWMAGPPSAGWGRQSGPSAPAQKGRVRLHQPRLFSDILCPTTYHIIFFKEEFYFFSRGGWQRRRRWAGPPSLAGPPPPGGLTGPPAGQPRGATWLQPGGAEADPSPMCPPLMSPWMLAIRMVSAKYHSISSRVSNNDPYWSLFHWIAAMGWQSWQNVNLMNCKLKF
jgi:hypothetical protein